MELNVRDTAAIFNVPESTVYRWIKEKNLPSREVNGDYRFGRAELLEWATVHKVKPAADIFRDANADNGKHLLYEALREGGVAFRRGGKDKAAVLREVVAGLPLPPGQDRESLLYLFLSREALGATAVGNGIAIPHPRQPIILPLGRPFLHLCFLGQPIDFGAADREGVHTLFVLICPTIRMHLQMLARIARLLREQSFLDVLKQTRGISAPGVIAEATTSGDRILDEVRRLEEIFSGSPSGVSEPV